MPGLRASALRDVADERSPEGRAPFHPLTQVLHERPGELRWELCLRTPPPALAGRVAGLWAGDVEATSAHHRALPNGELWVMFNLGRSA